MYCLKYGFVPGFSAGYIQIPLNLSCRRLVCKEVKILSKTGFKLVLSDKEVMEFGHRLTGYNNLSCDEPRLCLYAGIICNL